MAQKSIKVVKIPKLHGWQQRVYEEKKRFNVLDCARRWGKTFFWLFLITKVVEEAVNTKQKLQIAYFSPSYKNLAPAWRDFLAVLEPIITRKNEQEHTAWILGLVEVEFWSLDKPKIIRGRKYRLVVIDEAAYVIALRRIFNTIILPTLADYEGEAWMMSSPQGFNDFHHFYQLHKLPLFEHEWMSWKRPTSDNPFIKKSEIERQSRLMTPDEFAQEYLAEFVTLGNSPFDIKDFEYADTYEQALDKYIGDRSKYASEEQVEKGQISRLSNVRILAKVRYWDLANSIDGDWTASVRNTITTEPKFIISHFWRMKGQWGKTYAHIKLKILSEPDVLHVFETAGLGSVCWQMIVTDPDLAHLIKAKKIIPATRRYFMENKGDRAGTWALELKAGNMIVVKQKGWEVFIDEVARYRPNEKNQQDDLIDSTSGSFLCFILHFGGYDKLLRGQKLQPKRVRQISYEKQELARTLMDVY